MAEFAFFQPDQILRGLRELESDGKYMRALNKAVGTRGSTHQKVKRLSTKKHVPLKYLGIEPDLGEKRFSFADTARLRLQPRSRDSTRTGLKLSNHAQAMQRELPRVAKLLSDNAHFGPLCNAAVQAASFEQSQFAREIRPALKVLEAETGVPVHISLAVLKKGSFAYGSSHRPGMSRFGWRARGCPAFCSKGAPTFRPIICWSRMPRKRRQKPASGGTRTRSACAGKRAVRSSGQICIGRCAAPQEADVGQKAALISQGCGAPAVAAGANSRI